MKNVLNARHWFLLIFMLVVASCNREEFLTPPVLLNQPITISGAKAWMENFDKADSNRNQPYAKRTRLWKQAVLKRTLQGVAYVQVPLEEEPNSRRIIYDPTSKDYVLAPKLQLLIYDYPDGKTNAVLMELAPTGEYAGSHQGFTTDQDFTGLQILRNWKGQFIKGNKFEKGKVIGKLGVVNSSGSRARKLGTVRWVHEYLFISCTSADGVLTAVGTTIDYPMGAYAPYPPTPDRSSPFSYQSCNSDWQSNGTDEYDVYTDDPTYDPYNPTSPTNPSDPFNPLTGSGSTPILELSNNKKALFGPCPDLTDAWRYQINFKPSSDIKDKLRRLAVFPAFRQNPYPYPYQSPQDWYVQSIGAATGAAVNLDNFSVFMDNLPIIDGRRMTVDEFANYIRLNLNDFVDTSFKSFEPHANTGENEAAIWQSYNAVGAVISIQIQGDNGSVIVTEHNHGDDASGWTFSTIHDPFNDDHPVSGTRTFTLYKTEGGYIFTTQGADRLTNYVGAFADVAFDGLPFAKADELWRGMQAKVAGFVNVHGANADILVPVINRPNWSEVKKALDENRSLSTVPCPVN